MSAFHDARCIDVDDYINCMENETFSVEEVFPFNYKYFKPTPFYSDLRHGIAQSVKINPGAISTSAAQTQTMNMKLNPKLSYRIILSDPKLQFKYFFKKLEKIFLKIFLTKYLQKIFAIPKCYTILES